MPPQTLFIHPKEVDRIRAQSKSVQLSLQTTEGTKRLTQSAHVLRSAAIHADLMADFSLSSPQSSDVDVTTLILRSPYPPRLLALADLEPMTLSDLRMNTHHRGNVLTVTISSPVVKRTESSWVVVRDKNEGTDDSHGDGDGERLELYLHQALHEGAGMLEAGEVFHVKEPFFTLNDRGEQTVRVNHPSDLVVAEQHKLVDDPRAETSASSQIAMARECLDKGRLTARKRAWAEAYTCYTRALRHATAAADSDLAGQIRLDRAHTAVKLGRFDGAREDALGSLPHIEDSAKQRGDDSKRYGHAGAAAYDLGDFEEAERCYVESLRLSPSARIDAHLRNVKQRLREQETGSYDFKHIQAALSKSSPRADAANYFARTTVRCSPGRRRGLFALRDIKTGDMVLAEKAFCIVFAHGAAAQTALVYDERDETMRAAPIGLHRAVMQKLMHNPSQVERVLDLYSAEYAGVGKKLILQDGVPIVDAFQVSDIIARNAFGAGGGHFGSEGEGKGEDATRASAGLWVRASYINHSCLPNVTQECFGDLLVFRALRDIDAGEEVLHAYDATLDLDGRRAAVERQWGFECECALCVAEDADGPELRAERQRLVDDVKRFVKSEEAAGAKRVAVVRARRMAAALGGTYDGVRYRSLPRKAIGEIQAWLARAPVYR